ncbi:kunitz-type serine protease inhibitor HMGS1 [Teleopsis dalmanni]|uniref:kunitz-type serine protease inhibitor HMGS1 n=1 Tax=Teleopsis dalmanni TaxID=139649 RepID=UPI0018CEB969|nr:kunitz-type serine protease inhibitor HMGS1 [Teleopsis dalmanni]
MKLLLWFFIHCGLMAACSINMITAKSRGLPNICLQPPPRSEGLCTVEIEGFYFDLRANDCKMYVVGGCRSTPGQSFGSRQDCLATCVHGIRRIQDLFINE